MPITYYKFLDTKDIDKIMVEGTIIISSFEYFRELEASQWGTVADPLEGASELTVTGDFSIAENSPELELINNANIGFGMFEKFASVSGGGRIEMSNVRFVHTLPNWFIFSLATGRIDQLQDAMCVRSNRAYDACLLLRDLPKLCQGILDRGRIRELSCNVKDIFAQATVNAVEYEARSQDIQQGPAIDPSPFKKDIRFADQSEFRVVFIPRPGIQIAHKRLVIEVPKDIKPFEEAFREFHP